MAFPPKLHQSSASSSTSFPAFDVQRIDFAFLKQSRRLSTNPSEKIQHQLESIHFSLRASPARILFQRSKPNLKAFSNFPESCSTNDADLETDLPSTPSAGFLRKAWVVGATTIASKVLGLLREIVLAAVFGVGPVTTAFKHALVFPSFFTSLLGGVNGPIHVAVATTLSKLPEESQRHLFLNAHAVMMLIGGVLGGLTYVLAEFIIYICAPGLWAVSESRITREIATVQLKLMTPCILFAGPVALGFGCLSAKGDNLVASLSPALSSITLIVSCVLYVSISWSGTLCAGNALSGGKFISYGASIGLFLQWIIQVTMHKNAGYRFIPISWKDISEDKDLHELLVLLLPASLSSGLTQIASFTDLYFASFIPGAAAALSYAYLLAMAPLGILVSTILLPLLPTFSRLEKPSSLPNLRKNIQEAILLLMALVLPITSSICFLAEPIISVLFQRFTFDSAASALVSSLLICYSIGSPFYILRELLVMLYYALGDGQRPFIISVVAILLNGILDWLFTFKMNLGAQGLVLATSSVTALSAILLLHLLSKKLRGLVDFAALVAPLFFLLVCSIISGLVTLIIYKMLGPLLSSVSVFRSLWLSRLLSVSLAMFLGMLGFYIPLVVFLFPRMKFVQDTYGSLLR